MPSWFATKGRLFGGGRGEPQAFSLHCSCGETLEGTRTKGPQVAVCRRCEQLHFVLPASPYPEPQEKPARRLMSAGTETDAEADSYALKPNSDGGPGSDGRGGEAREGGSQPTDLRGQAVFQPPPVPPAIPPVVLPRVLPGGGMVVPRRVDHEPPPRPRVAGEPARPVIPRPVDGPGGGGPAPPSQGARPDVAPSQVGPGDPHDPPRGRRGGPLEPDGRTGPRRGDSKKSLPRQDRSTGRQRESRGTQPLRGREEPERQVPPGGPVSSPGSIPPGTATPHPPGVLGPRIAIGPAERGHGGPVAGAPVAGATVPGAVGADPREPGRGESADWQAVPRAQARRAKWRVRLAMLASLGLAGLGGAWLWNVHADRQAVATFDRELPLAEQAAAQGDLLTAAEHYQPVLKALTRLRRQDPRGLRIRQTARETVAAAGLCASGLTELLSEAIEGEASGAWGGMFRQQYQGQWVVFDVPIRVQRGQSHRYQIDCPVHPQGEAVNVVCDFPELERLNLSESEPRRVIFAGQLSACQPPQVATPSWVLQLDPHTAFLWVDPVGLQKLGFSADERLNGVLRAQAQVVGLEPTTEGPP